MRKIVLAALIWMAICMAAQGADAEYRLMHNDHDVLLVGVLTELKPTYAVIEARDYIVSAKDIRPGASARQIRPERVTLSRRSVERMRAIDYGTGFHEGDYVVASLVKSGLQFAVEWGIFKADSTDIRTLSVEAYSPEMAAMLKDFINSGGKNSEFAFSGGAVYRVTGTGEVAEKVLLYTDESGGNAERRTQAASEQPPQTKTTHTAAYALFGGAAALTLALAVLWHAAKSNHAEGGGH